jgi:hypothetical protein
MEVTVVTFIGGWQADRSYSNFRWLVVADKNCLIFVSFFFEQMKFIRADKSFYFSYSGVCMYENDPFVP